MRWFRLDLNPDPWAIGSVGIGRRDGRLTGSVGRNQQLHNYQEAVRETLRAKNPEKLSGPVELEFYFWRQMQTYRTEQSRTARKHEADVTNLQKSTEDALQGILFDNDRDVVHCDSRIVQQSADVEPLILIGIRHAEHFGLEDLPRAAYDLLESPGPALPFGDEVKWDVGDWDDGDDEEVPF